MQATVKLFPPEEAILVLIPLAERFGDRAEFGVELVLDLTVRLPEHLGRDARA